MVYNYNIIFLLFIFHNLPKNEGENKIINKYNAKMEGKQSERRWKRKDHKKISKRPRRNESASEVEGG